MRLTSTPTVRTTSSLSWRLNGEFFAWLVWKVQLLVMICRVWSWLTRFCFTPRFFFEQLVSGDVLYVYHDKHEQQDVSALKRAFVVMITGHMKVICLIVPIPLLFQRGGWRVTQIPPMGSQQNLIDQNRTDMSLIKIVTLNLCIMYLSTQGILLQQICWEVETSSPVFVH